MDKPCVLLVDDSEALRHLTLRALRKHDVEVVEESSAEAGLARLDSLVAAGRAVLLVTDNRMPGKSGAQLIEEARERHPALRAVMLTSSEPPREVRAALEERGASVIVRPARQLELEQVVTTLIRAWSARGPGSR